jgi:DNA-binding NarL/FixJ family response regulator
MTLGDHASAALELDAAGDTFARLGARPDLAVARSLARGSAATATAPAGASELSPREREVLAELAAGRSNRQIAETLVISPHTVGRHVENIFAKLDVTTRAAATARAFEHGLL